MKLRAFERLQKFTEPGSMGVVTDTRFIRCYWPALDQPTAIFAEGSSGLKVFGPPSPRNIVFPEDTIFEEAVPDAFLRAEQAVKKFSPNRMGLANLSDEEAKIWADEYDQACLELGPHCTKLSVNQERFFLKQIEGKKVYVAPLSVKESSDLCNNLITKESLVSTKEFVSPDDGSVLVKGGK